jgi:hypothetical protein
MESRGRGAATSGRSARRGAAEQEARGKENSVSAVVVSPVASRQSAASSARPGEGAAALRRGRRILGVWWRYDKVQLSAGEGPSSNADSMHAAAGTS